jgi:hypothetical protein
MELETMLAAVRNDRIQFVTAAPEGSPFTTLDRQVIVTNPAELVALSKTGDFRVLESLVGLLADSQRAWAAVVVLAALTGVESKTVDVFAAHPDQWWQALGPTAQERWQAWLDETKGTLVWDKNENVFVPNGN